VQTFVILHKTWFVRGCPHFLLNKRAKTLLCLKILIFVVWSFYCHNRTLCICFECIAYPNCLLLQARAAGSRTSARRLLCLSLTLWIGLRTEVCQKVWCGRGSTEAVLARAADRLAVETLCTLTDREPGRLRLFRLISNTSSELLVNISRL